MRKLKVGALWIMALGLMVVGAGVLAQPIAKSASGVSTNQTLAKEQVELVQKALTYQNRLARVR